MAQNRMESIGWHWMKSPYSQYPSPCAWSPTSPPSQVWLWLWLFSCVLFQRFLCVCKQIEISTYTPNFTQKVATPKVCWTQLCVLMMYLVGCSTFVHGEGRGLPHANLPSPTTLSQLPWFSLADLCHYLFVQSPYWRALRLLLTSCYWK